jgi:hypothetical protein
LSCLLIQFLFYPFRIPFSFKDFAVLCPGFLTVIVTCHVTAASRAPKCTQSQSWEWKIHTLSWILCLIMVTFLARVFNLLDPVKLVLPLQSQYKTRYVVNQAVWWNNAHSFPLELFVFYLIADTLYSVNCFICQPIYSSYGHPITWQFLFCGKFQLMETNAHGLLNMAYSFKITDGDIIMIWFQLFHTTEGLWITINQEADIPHIIPLEGAPTNFLHTRNLNTKHLPHCGLYHNCPCSPFNL